MQAAAGNMAFGNYFDGKAGLYCIATVQRKLSREGSEKLQLQALLVIRSVNHCRANIIYSGNLMGDYKESII